MLECERLNREGGAKCSDYYVTIEFREASYRWQNG